LPILALTSDSIATHAIYWMSANPSNEFSAREMVRSDWRERFSIDSTNDNNRRYQVGFALAIPCVLLSVWLSRVLVDADRVRHAKGTIALLTLSALLFAVAWFRSGFTLNSLTLTWSFISHWYNFGVNVAYPPYVFQSPAGSPLRRQLLLLASVLVMSAAVFSLTHSFFWSVEWHRSHSLEMTVFEGLWLLVRILCLFFINTLAVGVLWFLGVFFLLGPALSFTFTALEVAHGHSSPSHRT
jgi:hypothetical protein